MFMVFRIRKFTKIIIFLKIYFFSSYFIFRFIIFNCPSL
nr:MAG TPA: hypothetical protein [Bacteriophage sp.]